MANKNKGEQVLKLGGQVYIMKLDLNASSLMQHYMKIQPTDMLQETFEWDTLVIRDCIACLLFDEIRKRCRSNDFYEITKYVGDLMEQDLTEEAEGGTASDVAGEWMNRIGSVITLGLVGKTIEELREEAESKKKQTKQKRKIPQKKGAASTTKRSSKQPTASE